MPISGFRKRFHIGSKEGTQRTNKVAQTLGVFITPFCWINSETLNRNGCVGASAFSSSTYRVIDQYLGISPLQARTFALSNKGRQHEENQLILVREVLRFE